MGDPVDSFPEHTKAHHTTPEALMGGKPNPGTKKDRRLKSNRKSKSKKGKK